MRVRNPQSGAHGTTSSPGVPGENGDQGAATGLRASFFRALWGVPSGPVGWVGARVLPFLAGRWYSLMAKELDLQPQDDLLDVGCGSGGLLEKAARARYVAGLDASEIQLGLARRRLVDRLPTGTAELVLGDAAALPWEDGRFSAVASLNCLKFLPDPDRGLREMLRVLRPGGRALIMIDPRVRETAEPGRANAFGEQVLLTLYWCMWGAAKSGQVNAIGERQWSAEDARAMLQRAGFDEVSVTQLPASYLMMQLLRGVKPA